MNIATDFVYRELKKIKNSVLDAECKVSIENFKKHMFKNCYFGQPLEVHFFYIHYSIHISIAIALILAIIQDTLHENKMSQKCVQCT